MGFGRILVVIVGGCLFVVGTWITFLAGAPRPPLGKPGRVDEVGNAADYR